MQVAAISDGDGGGDEMRVVVTRRWVGVMKDGGGGGWRRKQLFVDAQIDHWLLPMIDLGVVW